MNQRNIRKTVSDVVEQATLSSVLSPQLHEKPGEYVQKLSPEIRENLKKCSSKHFQHRVDILV